MVTAFSYNRHPAYQYLLSHADIDFIVCDRWDATTRPRPDNVTFVDRSEIEWALSESDVWLSHLITPDLVDLLRYARRLGRPERIVQVMHGRADRTDHIQSSGKRAMYDVAKRAIQLPLSILPNVVPIEYVYITPFVANSWRMDGHVIEPGAPTGEITPASSRDGPPLVVGNDLDRGHFAIDMVRHLQQSRNVRVCGANDAVESTFMPWTELVQTYQSACCYLNLLRPPENAFNLATLEAMAGGCPIVTLPHPNSPFTHEETALVCETPAEFETAIDRLAEDRALRERLSEASRELATTRFDMDRFSNQWERRLDVSRHR